MRKHSRRERDDGRGREGEGRDLFRLMIPTSESKSSVGDTPCIAPAINSLVTTYDISTALRVTSSAGHFLTPQSRMSHVRIHGAWGHRQFTTFVGLPARKLATLA